MRWQEIFTGSDWPARTSPRSTRGRLHRTYIDSVSATVPSSARQRKTIISRRANYVSLPGYIEILEGPVRRAIGTTNAHERAFRALLDRARGWSREGGGLLEAGEYRARRPVAPGALRPCRGRHHDASIDPRPGDGDYRLTASPPEAAIAYYARERPDVFFLPG